MAGLLKTAVAAAGALGLFTRLQTSAPKVNAFSTSQSSYQVAGPMWNLGRLNHVAIAVPDLEKASAFYKNVLGAQVSEVVPVPEHRVSVVFVNLGNTKMELLHPLGDDSPIAGFLQKNKAGGIHHVCIEDLPCWLWYQIAFIVSADLNLRQGAPLFVGRTGVAQSKVLRPEWGKKGISKWELPAMGKPGTEEDAQAGGGPAQGAVSEQGGVGPYLQGGGSASVSECEGHQHGRLA
ncbi:methylmalonyl-CoA epimerase, mitochondrial [Suricata suricatta]|uniref:methylmalonyl-CoA epimerase, mitochondrial n=1 Tax=Suricata suricatta TaxID=37032 RepID=UPI001155E1D5|nr:methylmalonyl-CoA epimerase, mitochondrial [Suricata suricatta]